MSIGSANGVFSEMSKSVMSARDRRFLLRATELAKLSACRFKHGAIIVKNGNPLGVGINYTVNDPTILDDDTALDHAAVHAEIAAINSCRKANLRGAVIYVARVNRKGEQRMSKPCPRCQKVLDERGIRKIFYTIESVIDLATDEED